MSTLSTPYTTLISVAQLQALQASGAPLKVFDCSSELMQPEAADRLYAQVHIACKFGYSRLVEDGVFGDATLWAVSVVQHKKRLVVDGEVGPMTLGAVVAEVGAVTKAKGR